MKIKNELHQELLAELEKISYQLKAADRKQIVKNFKKKHPDLTKNELVELLDSLAQGESSDEIYLIGRLLQFLPTLRKQLSPSRLHSWLENAQGWAEVDVICQSTFTPEEMLNNWDEWEKILTELLNHQNIYKRRASLVLLTKPLRDSADEVFAQMALKHVEHLKEEDHKLITKAISWVLRTMIKHHREKIEEYLEKNADNLPAIAVRETRNKLETGTK